MSLRTSCERYRYLRRFFIIHHRFSHGIGISGKDFVRPRLSWVYHALIPDQRDLPKVPEWDIPLRDGEGRHREPAQLDGFSQFASRNIVIDDEVFVCCRLVVGGIFAFQLDKVFFICYIRSR